jgi:F0F1-type ATP synthase epsilon subunit
MPTPSAQPDQSLLQIEVFSPNGSLLNVQGYSVSSQNVRGPFDILPKHSHFISLVEEYLEIIDAQKRQIEYNFKTGVIRCYDGVVQIYLLTEVVPKVSTQVSNHK